MSGRGLRWATLPEPVRQKVIAASARTAEAVAPIKKRGMNKLETRFAQWLEGQRIAGKLVWWAFEPMKFRLGEGAYYKPDFVTQWAENGIVVYETKGFWREAARVRCKVFAGMYPFTLIAAQWRGGEWAFEVFRG